MKICHFTSAHNSDDIRVFVKECCSLASEGYDVYLVSQGYSREEKGVHVVGVGEKPKNRIKRMMFFSKSIYKKAIDLNCDIYHFHDPELLPYGLKIKRKGKKVIFDSHEDVPGQIMDKVWIPKPIRKLVSLVYKCYETYVSKRIDAVITATEHIEQKFYNRSKRVITINNYPRLDDIVYHDSDFSKRDAVICYAGGISDNRGEGIMVKAMKGISGILKIAGDHEKKVIGNVEYLGRLDRNEVNKLYGESIVGLCILKPIENYYYSQPIKMYEYMAAGLPFICSDFPSWQKVVEDSEGGICIDPNNIEEIQKTISSFLNNRSLAQETGIKGHNYVINNCTWNNEEKKLNALYKSL